MNTISGGSQPNSQKQNKILMQDNERNGYIKRKTPELKNRKHDLQLSPVRRSLRIQNRLIYRHFDFEKSIHHTKLIRKKKYESVGPKRLTADIYVHILKQCDPETILNFGLTSRQNNIISRVETVWKQRCYSDFNLIERWPQGTYLKIYCHFYKAIILSKWTDLFRPGSQLRISFISWFLTKDKPPHQIMSILSLKQVQTLWGISYRDIRNHIADIPGISPGQLLCTHAVSWSNAYELALLKFGSEREMQRFILQRCYRSIDVINQLIRLYHSTTKNSKFYDSSGNQIRFLLKNIPKGNVEFYKTFGDFIEQFQMWAVERSKKQSPDLSMPNCLEYFNVGIHFSIKQINKARKSIKTAIGKETLMTWAQTYTERYIKIASWQHQNKIQTVHHRYRYDNYRCQTLLSSYLETGDCIAFDELINYHIRLKRLFLCVMRNNNQKECSNIQSFKNRKGSLKRIAKQAALKYVNSGLEEDFTRFFVLYNNIISSNINFIGENNKFDKTTNSKNFWNFSRQAESFTNDSPSNFYTSTRQIFRLLPKPVTPPIRTNRYFPEQLPQLFRSLYGFCRFIPN